MIVNMEVNACWCGNTKFEEYKKIFWNNKNYILATCEKCDTIRVVDNNVDIDYVEDACLYKSLSHRHLESLKTIKKYIHGQSLLDIGCNTGLVLKTILDAYPTLDVEGVEINTKAIENSVIGKSKIKNCFIDKLVNQYDNITLIHVLEHIPNLKNFFKDLSNISKKNTVLYFAVPNIKSFNAKRNLVSWGALNLNEHIWFFTKKTLEKCIKEHLPSSEILEIKTSWVWPTKYKFINSLFEGDQIEVLE